MGTDFSLRLNKWEDIPCEKPEIQCTGGFLEIQVKNRLATKHEDLADQLVRNDIFLAAYPLAYWAASVWWRLNYEPRPPAEVPLSYDWRASHEAQAAGDGFLWPPITFIPDGRIIWARQSPSSIQIASNINYFEEYGESISAKSFENGWRAFINQTLARLSSRELRATDLKELWEQVENENQSPALKTSRILEANLGYDPEEGPPGVLAQLTTLSQAVGLEAVAEMASACSREIDPSYPALLANIVRQKDVSLSAAFNVPNVIPSPEELKATEPWQLGYARARTLRDRLNLGGKPLSQGGLAELFSLTADKLQSPDFTDDHISLGLRGERQSPEVGLRLQKVGPTSLRFLLARFIGDYLNPMPQSQWLAATKCNTWRQKMQRAFASEFLCPLNELRDMLGGDYSADSQEKAAAYFDVSPLMVNRHLVNNRVLSPDSLIDYAA